MSWLTCKFPARRGAARTTVRTRQMVDFGWIVYALLLALLLLFWRKVRRRSLYTLIEQGTEEHHHVHRVLAKHPEGGTWTEHQHRMSEEA
ncbi:MAG TPA: hypothetical protein QGG32_03595, partial [Rhodospirillales bacterium]|nr:hypothetical protein [Rhodospirillales bacterium]